MRSVEQIPASIIKAICEIKRSLSAVAKTQRNSHGGYMFASTDDIYAALTRKMGEVGLVIVTLEDNCDIKRFEKTGNDGKTQTVQWAHLEYSFVLATEDATWTDPRAKRTLYIQVTGPQTFQAATSFAEKAYLRSLFKIPSGDMDLDSMPQAETLEGQHALNGNGAKRKSSAAAKREGFDKTFNEIKLKIETAETAEMLEQLPDLYADEIGQMPRAWGELIQNTYEDRMSELRPE